MMTPEQAVIVSIVLCVTGAVLTWLVSRSKTAAGWLAFAITAATAVLIFSAAAKVLTAGPSESPATFWAMPNSGFALRIHVDGLTAVFLMLAALVATFAAFYSIDYMRSYKEYGVARYYPNFLLFLAAMYGLLSTTDMMWFFFIFWQMMTLPGYALIRYENKKPENIRAADKYLIMMQIACIATMFGAEIFAATGAEVSHCPSLKYDFDTVCKNLPAMLAAKPGMTAVAFALFLIGFGIKMGMWPFGQVWLPDAHPAAPSPVSAMLSGVMIKTGVYGLMRYFLWLVPAGAHGVYPVHYWGIVVTLLGTVTLLTGTVQALRQDLTKRLLAFSTIGQAGYILLGLGVCMTLIGSTDRAISALGVAAFYGALFHTLNHGVFKSLLFLNAGSVLHATGTQDMNKLGGLVRYMPATALTAFIASLSIAGVPLLNGFASKWGIFTAAIQGNPACRLLPLCVMVAIFTSAVTLALFMKFYGVMFLSRTSTLVADRARQHPLEVGWKMRLPQTALAAICVVFGLLPALPVLIIRSAMQSSRQGFGEVLAATSPLPSGGWVGIGSLNHGYIYAPVVLALVLAAMFLVTRCVSKLGGAQRRVAIPWLCGYAKEADIHRYHARNFYAEVKRLVGWMGGAPRPQREQVPAPDDK